MTDRLRIDARVVPVAAAFGGRLRQLGLAMSPDRVARFVRAVQVTRPVTVDDLYWTARVTLVSGQADLERFDSAFDEVFGGWDDPVAARGDPSAPPPSAAPHHAGRDPSHALSVEGSATEPVPPPCT